MDKTATLFNQANQENNEFLLNAIKNKFAAGTSKEGTNFSPPKFVIPNLKTSSAIPSYNGYTLEEVHASTSPKLTEITLSKSSHRPVNGEIVTNGFVVPKLQFTKQVNGPTRSEHELIKPLLNNKARSFIVSSISAPNINQDNKLNAKEKQDASGTIDLTTALSCCTISTAKKTIRTKPIVEEFEIPFIECDRRLTSKVQLERMNSDWETETINLNTQRYLAEPSSFGLSFEHKPKQMAAKLRFSDNINPKYIIVPFHFNTPSPDDIVLATLKDHRLQRYN